MRAAPAWRATPRPRPSPGALPAGPHTPRRPRAPRTHVFSPPLWATSMFNAQWQQWWLAGKSGNCYRIWGFLLSNNSYPCVFCLYFACILPVFCMYLTVFLRICRIHRIHVSDAYPTCIRCIHLYPPSRQKYARICPRIRTVDSHSVGRKRGFVSIFVFFAEYIVNTRCIHTYLDVFRRNIREYELTLAETGLCRRSCQPSHRF